MFAFIDARAECNRTAECFDGAVVVALVRFLQSIFEIIDGGFGCLSLSGNAGAGDEDEYDKRKHTVTHDKPPQVEARPPCALRCRCRRCIFVRRKANELCIVIRASLLSEVATGLFLREIRATALKLKRANQKKVTKDHFGRRATW